jgi:glutamine synthetase
MKSSSEILQELKNSNTKKVKLAAVDIDGVLRGKIVSIEKFEASDN